jgi:hypothetical protein
VTQPLLWWLISIARPDYPTRLLCYATRFTSSSVSALKHIGGVCANCFVSAGPALRIGLKRAPKLRLTKKSFRS